MPIFLFDLIKLFDFNKTFLFRNSFFYEKITHKRVSKANLTAYALKSCNLNV
jgi:hypothetical protein